MTDRKEASTLSDAEILAIAQDPETAPFSPWWNDDTQVGEIRKAALAFARALESRLAVGQPVAQAEDLSGVTGTLGSSGPSVKRPTTAAPDRPQEPQGDWAERWRNPELAASETPKAQEGTWILVAPDGREFSAPSPIKCVAAESNERIPPQVALARIARGLDEDEQAEKAEALSQECATVLMELVALKTIDWKYANDVPDSPRHPLRKQYLADVKDFGARWDAAWAAARALCDRPEIFAATYEPAP